MKKAELVKKVQEALNLHSQKEAANTIEKVAEVLVDVLKSDEEVSFGVLGKFLSVKRPARTCKNPKSGEEMHVPEKKALRFRPSKKAKETVNK